MGCSRSGIRRERDSVFEVGWQRGLRARFYMQRRMLGQTGDDWRWEFKALYRFSREPAGEIGGVPPF
jgi:hypothetical protein